MKSVVSECILGQTARATPDSGATVNSTAMEFTIGQMAACMKESSSTTESKDTVSTLSKINQSTQVVGSMENSMDLR